MFYFMIKFFNAVKIFFQKLKLAKRYHLRKEINR
jgi:hypothetical protein